MPDYKKEYSDLFNTITDLVERLERARLETQVMEYEDDSPAETEAKE